ncbi:MAG: MFS transporter [Acidimicrobiales bacterium]
MSHDAVPDRGTAGSPWRVLGGVCALYAAFGLVAGSTGALVPSIRDDLGLSRSQIGVVLGAWQFAYIGASIPAGRLIDRIGLRRAMTVSIVVIVASGVARSAAQGLWSLAGSVALLGIGAPIVSIGAPKAAAVLFDDADRRRAVGLYGAAPALGTTLALATANGVVGAMVGHDWRKVMLVFAALAGLAGAFWLWASRGLETRSAPGDDQPVSFASLTGRPIVRLILAVAVMSFLFVHGIGQWLVDLLQAGDRSAEAAGYLASIASVVGMAGTIFIPRLATPRRRRLMFAVLLSAGAAGTLLLTASATWLVLPALVASTLARAAVVPIAMLVLMDHPDVGPVNMAGAGSLFFTAAQFGGVAGPYLTGVAADADPTFGTATAIHAGLMLAVGAMLLVGLSRLSPAAERPSARPTR